MSLANFLAERYGAAMVMESLKAAYPPAIVLIDALGERALPDAIDRWADAHMKYVASQPPAQPAATPSPAQPDWASYRHRFLTEKPALRVLLDLFKDLGLTDLAGINVEDFIDAMVAYRADTAAKGA